MTAAAGLSVSVTAILQRSDRSGSAAAAIALGSAKILRQ